MAYKTEQEKFWAGEFGDQYLIRNDGPELLASNVAFFSRALRMAGQPRSIIEFGSNIGMNMKAMKVLYPHMDRYAIEIHKEASEKLKSHLGEDNVYNGSIFDFQVTQQYDVALIRGVLIHIDPSMLQTVYEKLYQATNKYVLLIEYYNPTPVEIDYRGHKGKLYKRDFAGEMLDKYPDLKLVDYGFGYHRDASLGNLVGDGTWFLMEKCS